MKKYHILKFVILVVFLSIGIELLYAQNAKNNLTFILKKYDSGKIFMNLPTGEKYVEFKITGFDNQSQIDSLTKQIARYRGVTSFIISNEVVDNTRTGKLTCYKYADNLLYYKHLFFVNNINQLIVDGKEVLTKNLLDIEK